MSTSQESVVIEDFMNTILREAIMDQASDIHIEPLPQDMRIRFRIDGTLHEKWRRPLYEFEPIINRIKVLANFDISARGIPQDGHISTMVYMLKSPSPQSLSPLTHAPSSVPETKEKKHLASTLSHLLFDRNTEEDNNETVPHNQDEQSSHPSPATERPAPPASTASPASDTPQQLSVRVSLFPTLDGDAIVLRLLNRENMLLKINNLGMSLGRRKKKQRNKKDDAYVHEQPLMFCKI